MKWSGAAPCQCYSPAGVRTTSPARMCDDVAAPRLDEATPSVT